MDLSSLVAHLEKQDLTTVEYSVNHIYIKSSRDTLFEDTDKVVAILTAERVEFNTSTSSIFCEAIYTPKLDVSMVAVEKVNLDDK